MTVTNLKSYLLPILFLSLLAIHGLDSYFQWFREPELRERRQLNEKPKFNISFLDPFPKDYEAYYNDSFNWRNYFIQASAYLNYQAFRQSAIPAKALIGKEGWLFKTGFQLDMYRGKFRFSPQQLAIIREELAYRQKKVEALGGRYYLCIAPMKHHIYPEFLPDNIRKINRESCTQQLIDFLQRNSAIDYIDLFKPLTDSKPRNRYPLYLKTDHHWTDYAGMLAAKVILDRLREDFPALGTIDTARLKFNTVNYNGLLLAQMIGLENEMTEAMPMFDGGAVQFSAQNGTRPYPVPTNFPFPEEYCMVKTTQRADLPKLMMVRESFATNLINLLGDHFAESVFLFDNWQHGFHPDIVNREQPDIYIQMIWEGMIYKLLPNPPEGAGW